MGTRAPIRSAPPVLARRLARRTIPMLAALLSAAAVAAAPAAATGAGDCIPAASWPADRADLAAQVVTLVNAHRAQLGLRRSSSPPR